MQWKGPYKVIRLVGQNDYVINMDGNVKDLSCQYVEEIWQEASWVDTDRCSLLLKSTSGCCIVQYCWFNRWEHGRIWGNMPSHQRQGDIARCQDCRPVDIRTAAGSTRSNIQLHIQLRLLYNRRLMRMFVRCWGWAQLSHQPHNMLAPQQWQENRMDRSGTA